MIFSFHTSLTSHQRWNLYNPVHDDLYLSLVMCVIVNDITFNNIVIIHSQKIIDGYLKVSLVHVS